jgi:hypothetical protein
MHEVGNMHDHNGLNDAGISHVGNRYVADMCEQFYNWRFFGATGFYQTNELFLYTFSLKTNIKGQSEILFSSKIS